jgi:phospholipid/cholesterol/gamma-HCH transport system substrate-binding protein
MTDGGAAPSRRRQEEEPPEEALPPAPPPRGAGQTAWVGLFLVVGLVATLGALLILTDAAIFRGRYIIITHVPDAGGIRRGDPVQMRGVNVGRVQRFRISPEGVEVRLEIEGEYAIPKDSYVQLTSAGLLGGMVADIVPGHSTEMLKYGDTLSGRSEAALADTTTKLANQAEDALARINTMLSQETIGNVQGSARDVRQLLQQLSTTVAEQRRQLNTLTASLQRSSSGLEKVTTAPELQATVKRLDATTRQMQTITASLDRSTASMEAVMGRVQRGEGTLGKLTADETLYNNLNQASVNLNRATQDARKLTEQTSKLIEDIQKNPRKYFKFSVF